MLKIVKDKFTFQFLFIVSFKHDSTFAQQNHIDMYPKYNFSTKHTSPLLNILTAVLAQILFLADGR